MENEDTLKLRHSYTYVG